MARKYILLQSLVALFIVLMSFHAVFSGTEDKWKTTKSTHFIIYYKNASDTFIEETIRKSEDLYLNITDSLGFTRFNFWLWDNRAKIYIYDDIKDYHKNTGQPEWSSGVSVIRRKIIFTFPYEKNFFETILPHEMGHIIFREFVGFDNAAVPVWLDEGIASYQEVGKYSNLVYYVKRGIISNDFFPIEKLFRIRPQDISEHYYVELFYAEAISLVGYLISEFGKDNFVIFCQYLRDKKDFVAAMSAAYHFKNIEEFENAWEKYVMEKFQ